MQRLTLGPECIMHTDIVFETARFNLSQAKPHFINDNCFGDDAAAWLRDKLLSLGIPTIEPAQEDWGWYIEATHAGSSYFIGIGGNPQTGAPHKNAGEWRIMIEKHRSLWEKLSGKNKLAPDEAILSIIRSVVAHEPDFSNVQND
jgi:hypothetical protein